MDLNDYINPSWTSMVSRVGCSSECAYKRIKSFCPNFILDPENISSNGIQIGCSLGDRCEYSHDPICPNCRDDNRSARECVSEKCSKGVCPFFIPGVINFKTINGISIGCTKENCEYSHDIICEKCRKVNDFNAYQKILRYKRLVCTRLLTPFGCSRSLCTRPHLVKAVLSSPHSSVGGERKS